MAMTLVALVLVAALNPLVVRSPEPRGNVPANCEVSDAPATPRVAVAQDPVEPAPPRTTRARSQYDLGPLQRTIATNNRTQFDIELARAREAGAPTRVYEDVGRLWDAQFEAPFFTEGSEPHRIASQYPGYEAAVREQIFTDASGRKFYPAAESRAFVARQTGVNLPASTRSQTRSTPQQSSSTRATTQQPSTRTTTTQQPSTRATTQPSNRATQQPSTRSTTRSTTRKSPPPPRTPATSQPQSKPPVARREPAPPRRSPDPSAAQKPAATVPAPVVPPVEHTSSTTAPPAAGSLPVEPVATTTTSAPPETETTATETTATDTATADTSVTDTATTTVADTTTTTTSTTTTGAAAPRSRSIILPAILILIGLGVLFLLFKAK